MKEAVKGKGSHANMPTEVKITPVPKCAYISNQGEIDDTMTGIDAVISKTVSKAKSHKSNQK